MSHANVTFLMVVRIQGKEFDIIPTNERIKPMSNEPNNEEANVLKEEELKDINGGERKDVWDMGINPVNQGHT